MRTVLETFRTNINHTNIHMIRDPEGEERQRKGLRKYREILAENFPKTG